MLKNIQTKLHSDTVKGNCFAAVVSCFLDCSIDIVPPVEEIMEEDRWVSVMMEFLGRMGYEWGSLDGHTDGFYIVVGTSPRDPEINHCCIYKDGVLWHDPHPDQTGLVDEKHFEYIDKISKN